MQLGCDSPGPMGFDFSPADLLTDLLNVPAAHVEGGALFPGRG